MIRIIKDGVKPKKYKKIYNLTCENCHCEFEFEESDCSKVRHEKRIDGEYRGEISCPFCSERLFVDFKTAKYRDEEIIEEFVDLGDRTIIDMDDVYQWSPSLCKCPKCGGNNTLRNDTIVLTSLPPQYNFKCKDCGHRWTGRDTMHYVDIIEFNEHCNNCPHKNTIGDACYSCPYSPIKITYNEAN